MHIRSFVVTSALALCLASCASTGKPRLTNQISYPFGNGGKMNEGQRSIHGKLRFESSSHYTKAFITDLRGRQTKIHWPKEKLDDRTIDTHKRYNVELLTRTYAEHDYVFSDLLRLSNKSAILFDASTCEVHHLPMQRQIENGVSACEYPNRFDEIQKKQFPNDGNAYLACGSGLPEPKWKCPTCAKAWLAWCKTNGVDPEF